MVGVPTTLLNLVKVIFEWRQEPLVDDLLLIP